MPVQPQYSARPGEKALLSAAQVLCRIVTAFAPIIRAKFPTREALLALLDATEAVCALLPAAQSEQAAADALPPEDFYPSELDPIPGQDPA